MCKSAFHLQPQQYIDFEKLFSINLSLLVYSIVFTDILTSYLLLISHPGQTHIGNCMINLSSMVYTPTNAVDNQSLVTKLVCLSPLYPNISKQTIKLNPNPWQDGINQFWSLQKRKSKRKRETDEGRDLNNSILRLYSSYKLQKTTKKHIFSFPLL